MLQDTVVLRGLDSNVQDALGLLQTACNEAEKSSQEIISPLEPHEAALFTLPDLKSTKKQIIDGLEGGHRVRCWLDEGAGDGAFGGMNVQVCMPLQHWLQQLAIVLLNTNSNVQLRCLPQCRAPIALKLVPAGHAACTCTRC